MAADEDDRPACEDLGTHFESINTDFVKQARAAYGAPQDPPQLPSVAALSPPLLPPSPAAPHQFSPPIPPRPPAGQAYPLPPMPLSPPMPPAPRPSSPAVAKLAFAPAVETAFRPVHRPPVARLVVLDDGESTTGEIVRLRDQVTVIGRIEGHVTMPHDSLVSARHAEIVRGGQGRSCEWILRDAGSSNGTYVCCSKAPLRFDRQIILGSRVFRFLPRGGAEPLQGGEGTRAFGALEAVGGSGPKLVEVTGGATPLEIEFDRSPFTIGRPRSGSDFEIDDPLLASRHVAFVRLPNGDWQIEPLSSRNGVWVQIQSIPLTSVCRFQCGEQRFLFLG